jgi:menaquinone-specific isochorismate synthase
MTKQATDLSSADSSAADSDFLNSFTSSFLKSGWMLALDADRILVGWGEWSESSVRPNSADSCALFAPDFYLRDERPWKWTQHWDLLQRDRFATLVLTAEAGKVNSDVAQGHSRALELKLHKFQWLEPQLTDFEKAWKEIHVGFEERGILKAVPVVFAQSEAEFETSRRLAMLKSLVSQPRHLYLYGMWSEKSGMIGASPELLFTRDDQRPGLLQTVALAGTRAKGKVDNPNSVADLLNDPKERFEHQLVIDDIKVRLSRIGDVTVGETQVLELPTLYHLKTNLKAKIASALGFLDCVKLLHPTPALGVAPRAAGFEEMLRWDEPSARSRFGAPFGASGSGFDHCLVAIRNIQWDGSAVRLGSGCGVVGDSVFEREWNELQLKRDSVKRMLDL